MARIRTLKQPAAVRVIVTGRLGAPDMRRLEHACATVLTSERADLIVDLHQVTEIDDVAEAHLFHMARRGAIIKTRG